MFTKYKLICMRSKTKVEACKTIIQCFTSTLQRWWVVESSLALITEMEAKVVKDKEGDIIYNDDGIP